MRRSLLLLGLIYLFTCSPYGQSASPKTTADDSNDLGRLWLLSDLQGLETKSAKLDAPLARALAKAEIADAAWVLDKAWAERLLREAYELALPNEEEQVELRSKVIGEPLSLPTRNEVARNNVRYRVLEIAGRDTVFANNLVKLGAERLGKQEENKMYKNLAGRAIADGDVATASTYILKALKSDPTIINAGYYILDIASKDRSAADKLILQYIDILRATPFSASNDGAFRAYYLLSNLVFPSDEFVAVKKILDQKNNNSTSTSIRISPPSASVIRAYVSYMIVSLTVLEQQEPGSAMKLRGYLLSTWLPLQQYAPELVGAFLELERKSRKRGEDSSLPQENENQASRTRYEERVKKALDSDQPDELTINFALSRGDFDKARKMIEKLTDKDQKAYFIETINTQEAISLATNGDLPAASRLAEKLNEATSILQAYPVIITKCAAQKDQVCVTALVYQAIKQLKHSAAETARTPGTISTPSATGRTVDPVLLSLSKLARSIISINETLAFEVLDEMVLAVNHSNIDTKQGNIGFETRVFKELAAKNENRARQAAANIQNPLQQIVALAAIYQWQAEGFLKVKSARP